jgi:hypothetical protein
MGTDMHPTGLDKVEQMFGKKSGHNVDPNKMRSTNEKIVSVPTSPLVTRPRESSETLRGRQE